MASSAKAPVGILITVALLALFGGYAIWSAIWERSLIYVLVLALAAAGSVVACVATAMLLAWSRYLVYLLTAAFIGMSTYSVYAAASVGYFSLFSTTSEIALSLAPEGLLVVLSCFCSFVVFQHFRRGKSGLS